MLPNDVLAVQVVQFPMGHLDGCLMVVEVVGVLSVMVMCVVVDDVVVVVVPWGCSPMRVMGSG